MRFLNKKHFYTLFSVTIFLATCQPAANDSATAVNPTATIPSPTPSPSATPIPLSSSPPVPTAPPGSERNPYWDDFLDATLTIQKGEGTLTIHTDGRQFSVAEFHTHIIELTAQARERHLRWVLHLPAEIDINQAGELFGLFASAEAEYISVYAHNGYGEYPRRDIALEVGANGPIRVVTATRTNYPQELQGYVGDPYPPDYLVANVMPGELDLILTPLLTTTDRKHIRLQEMSTFNGIPAAVFVTVLDELQTLGVETLTFYGVFTE